MKRQFYISLIYIFLTSCSQHSNYNGPVVAPSKIVKDVMSWLYYERDYMFWSGDYTSLDGSLNPITKSEFLKRLTTGAYFPVKISTRDSSLCYQLYKLEDSTNKEIGEIIKNKAQIEKRYYEMEGTPLPRLNFIDLDNNVYNINTTKDKILVLNCWFIHCKPCVEEMPKLNQLVKQLKNRKDIVFIGLAFDPASDLINFLKKTRFNYKIIPDKKDYLMSDLGIVSYPTHLIINKQGAIVKVTDDLKEMLFALNKEIVK